MLTKNLNTRFILLTFGEEKMLEGYYIVENSGVVPAERRFKFKDLKAWGYDLHLGTIEGEGILCLRSRGEKGRGRIYS